MELPVSATSESLNLLLSEFKPRMIAIGLALAAATPGPAGEAGAVSAIVYDVSRRRWVGVALSAASMIPLAGYLPALAKIIWLLFDLNQHLKHLETMLPQLHKAPENIEALRGAFGKCYRGIPRLSLTRSLRNRLARIMAVDNLSLADFEPPKVRT